MRIVITLGGNAPLSHSDPMTIGVQRRKTGRRAAIGSLAGIARIVAGAAGTNVVAEAAPSLLPRSGPL